MVCAALTGVTLSPAGKKTLKDIAQRAKLATLLKPVMAASTLFNALVDNNAIPVIFNVQSTDWVALAKAMKSVDPIARKAIQTEISMRILDTTGKENTFWKYMYECY